jgi:hypothetical protein
MLALKASWVSADGTALNLPPGQVLVKVELEEEVVDDAGGIACIR